MLTVTATPLPAKGGATIRVTSTAPPTIVRVDVSRKDSRGFETRLFQGDGLIVTTPGTIEDMEAPLDVAVTYVARQAEPVGTPPVVGESAPITIDSTGRSWLKDPGFPSMNVEIPVVTSIAELSRASKSGTFDVIDRRRPIVVTSRRSGPTGTLIAHTITADERIQLSDLLDRGTVLLIQTPAAYGFGNAYVVIGETTETRTGLAAEQSRQWTLPFVMVDRPEGLSARPDQAKTWRAVRDIYPTWADLKATGRTYRILLEEGP